MNASPVDTEWRYMASSSGRVELQRAPVIVIDVCAALLAPRLRLEACLKVLGEQGVEVAIYSALPAWNTRAALRSAGMLEWFDHVWHMDAMSAMHRNDYAILTASEILSTPQHLAVKRLMRVAGVPATKVPPWLRWLV